MAHIGRLWDVQPADAIADALEAANIVAEDKPIDIVASRVP